MTPPSAVSLAPDPEAWWRTQRAEALWLFLMEQSRYSGDRGLWLDDVIATLRPGWARDEVLLAVHDLAQASRLWLTPSTRGNFELTPAPVDEGEGEGG